MLPYALSNNPEAHFISVIYQDPPKLLAPHSDGGKILTPELPE